MADVKLQDFLLIKLCKPDSWCFSLSLPNFVFAAAVLDTASSQKCRTERGLIDLQSRDQDMLGS